MYSMTILVGKAKSLMDSLKPQQVDDDSARVLLDLDPEDATVGHVVITPNGTTPDGEEVDSNN